MGFSTNLFDKPLFSKVGTLPNFLKSKTTKIRLLFTLKHIVFQLLIHNFKEGPKAGVEPAHSFLRMIFKNPT